jgi:dTDP-4-dehydrorhamnose reductase
MNKILIFGAAGMAGSMISRYLIDMKYEVHTADLQHVEVGNYSYIDAFDSEQVVKLILEVHPDVVINCIGLLNENANNNVDKAIYLNSFFPHFLDKLSTIHDYKLIHISTDCVFDGVNNYPYLESSVPNGQTIYDKTKALGEVVERNSLTFRNSIIGPDLNENGIGLFMWVLKQKNEIKGYKNVFWSGITTLELSKAIHAAIIKDLKGLYHLTNNVSISKYDLIRLITEVYKLNIKITGTENPKSNKTLINTRTDFDYSVPNYREMLMELKEYIEKSDYKRVMESLYEN